VASLRTHWQNGASPLERRLAWPRYQLRRFLRFSEQAARASGITPQQHQLLLGVKGFTGRGSATVSELAEFLQERHNAVVGLVERAARRGLVSKVSGRRDRRTVVVSATRQGETILKRLSRLHQREFEQLRRELLAAARAPRRIHNHRKEQR
jgi:DNA-binding MarR family transcriptional regulator